MPHQVSSSYPTTAASLCWCSADHRASPVFRYGRLSLNSLGVGVMQVHRGGIKNSLGAVTVVPFHVISPDVLGSSPAAHGAVSFCHCPSSHNDGKRAGAQRQVYLFETWIRARIMIGQISEKYPVISIPASHTLRPDTRQQYLDDLSYAGFENAGK